MTFHSDANVLAFLSELENEEMPPSGNDSIVPPGERLCPICQEKMEIESQHDIIIDVCPQHGMWLDRGELPKMIARVRSGNTIDRIEQVRRARRDGKVSGAMFGMWSLLLD